jgi:membrane protease YdiL (CAAX protease family)
LVPDEVEDLHVAPRPVWRDGGRAAALFAFLHGLNGGFFLEFPHRFVMGLMLGWLRARTGSLWPCVLAHFLHNGFVVVVS